MQYLLHTWNDKEVETTETVLPYATLEEAISCAVEVKQAQEDLEVKLYQREHADSYLIKHVVTIELTAEQKLAAYWNGSISGQLKKKTIKSI